MTNYIYGIHAVQAELEALGSNAADEPCLLIDRKRKDQRIKTCVDLANNFKIKLKFVSSKKLDSITTGNHQGIILLKNHSNTTLENHDLFSFLSTLPKPAMLLILDGITDPRNLGACLRVADGVGVDAVIAPKDKAVAINPTVAKVASGATVPFFQVNNLVRCLQQLKSLSFILIGTDDKASENIYSQDFSGKIAIVLGSEGSGLRRLTKETCQYLVSIPMLGTVTSLNVSVAAGVVLYQALFQRK